MKKMLIFSLIFVSNLYAQESRLVELQKSKEYVKTQQWINVPDDALPPNVDPNSGYAEIFKKKNGYLLIKDWLGNAKSFRQGQPLASLRKDVLDYSCNYQNDKNKILLRIVIPKPRLLEAAEFKLLPELRQFEPPVISVVQEEKIPIKESIEGTFLTYNTKSCAVRIKLPKESILFISSYDCSKKELLTKLTDELAIQNLVENLN